MDRREFLSTLVAGVSVNAAVRTWPFRVLSFPTELRIFSMEELRRIYIERALAEIDSAMANSQEAEEVAAIMRSLPPPVEETVMSSSLRSRLQVLCDTAESSPRRT